MDRIKTRREIGIPWISMSGVFLREPALLLRIVFSQREAVSGRLTDIDPKEEKRADESNAQSFRT